ncbi:MAG TPA: DegT/DnrJ/EryC1/StrS family aminotransferase [Candidatus Binatia bacterium]|nr:DegT/DnrJ/EryC1/StrS family aminotransferase [Candidatus Binatia bacterium]
MPPGLWFARPARRGPHPLGTPGCHLFARGRHGLWQGVRALGLRPGDEVLVPAYHHGSEVEALVRADLVCRFYGGGETLAPEPMELESLRRARTRALHLIHYLGFPQDSRRWRRWCDERGLLLIEDAAQAWLASSEREPLGTHADLSLTCLYKTFGLPDGAAVVCRAPLVGVAGRAPLGLVALLRQHALWVATRVPALGGAVRRLGLAGRRRGDDDIALGDTQIPPSALTRRAVARLVCEHVAAARRRNFAYLAERLGARLPRDFRRLPEGASPLAFPLVSDDRRRLLDRLAAEGVRALELWQRPHPALPVERFPYAARLRATLVGLPVHQELRAGDVERVIAAVERAER